MSADFICELPFGKSKPFFNRVNGWANQLTFGQFQGVMDPRTMPFALRYEF